jgi:Mrp family chromosome partitioning ATPase
MMIDDQRAIVLHLTATRHGEGTTTIARELAAAVAAANWGRVALLDAEPLSQNAASGPALLDAFERGQEPSLRPGWINGAPVGLGRLGAPGRPAPRVQTVRGLFAWLRSEYTLTVVDCPPVLAARDIAVLASVADGTLLVIEAEQTSAADIGRARDILDQFGASMLGAVLNKRRTRVPRFMERLL